MLSSDDPSVDFQEPLAVYLAEDQWPDHINSSATSIASIQTRVLLIQFQFGAD
jgi:hypothetical protein